MMIAFQMHTYLLLIATQSAVPLTLLNNNTEEDPEHLTTTFVPGNYRSMTEEENIKRSLEKSSSNSVTWPT